MSKLETKRFVIRKSLIGKNVVITFTILTYSTIVCKSRQKLGTQFELV